jgi:hypothetical protein
MSRFLELVPYTPAWNNTCFRKYLDNPFAQNMANFIDLYFTEKRLENCLVLYYGTLAPAAIAITN